ncbi:MAG: diaminopimelate epimerase [Puniceicoccales bacterium]|jgi:diaminopimelate epimerase|nr:diaminopimelate epimerase [Puniceicoccales bacterium]
MENIRFFKYHALGNDYLVLDPRDWKTPEPPSPEQIRKICHRHYGLGSDGILFGPLPTAGNKIGLRIFNPDGSEAGKSGNGLRIFSLYLYERERETLVKAAPNKFASPFPVVTPGGVVQCAVLDGGARIRVEMGRVSFRSDEIPVVPETPVREVISERLTVAGRHFFYCAATVGNPHCVIPVTKTSAKLAQEYGPFIETHSSFPNRTNVQFLEIIDRRNIRIEIWERGAGYTLASGSSSSAAAAVARKLDLCDADLTVHMPGGKIEIAIAKDFSVLMTGPATPVGVYQARPEILLQDIIV